MAQDLFQDFQKFSDVSLETYAKYQDRLPEGILEVWRQYGFGSILEGYLKIINPDYYIELIRDTYFKGEWSIPVFVTAFGDVIVWQEERYLFILYYKDRDLDCIEAGFKYFWEDLEKGSIKERLFEIDLYKTAVSLKGTLAFDECFGYVPLLGLGGKKDVSHLEKVKIREHIEIISALVGNIE